MKFLPALVFVALAFSVSANSATRSFTADELVRLALSDNPELRFYEQQVSALPKVSHAKLPIIPEPLDFPSRETFRRAVLDLDANLARLHLAVFRAVLAGTVRLKAMEYHAARESASTAGDLASRISALVTMLKERPAAGIQALIERRILEGAALPFLRQAAEANVKRELLRTELNGLIGQPSIEEPKIVGDFALPPEPLDQRPDEPLLLRIREAEIVRGLVGLDAASEIESFSVGSWFTREGLGANDAVAGITRPGTTAGSAVGDTKTRLIEDARAKLARETAQRRAAAKAAREVASAIPPELVENLRGASDLAERQYRVGALGVNLLIEAQREYLDALQSRNEALIQAWRNHLDLDLLSLSARNSLNDGNAIRKVRHELVPIVITLRTSGRPTKTHLTMKTRQTILTVLAIGVTAAFSADDHNHKPMPGPRGGKVLETRPLHAEFFVQPDKKVSVSFYDESMKPVAPEEQVVKVIAEAPSGRITLDFEKTGDAFASTGALPEGDGYRLVVQIRQTPDAKPQNFRIDYHAEICGECKHPEYACICPDHTGHTH